MRGRIVGSHGGSSPGQVWDRKAFAEYEKAATENFENLAENIGNE